jgi:Holliday junction resolvase RusA-like endonuclease
VNRIAFSIPGVPKGKDRPRSSARVVQTADGPRAAVRVHSDAATVAAEKAILAEFKRRFPRHVQWVGPVLLKFTAVFPTTSEFTKAQLDAAARGVLYHTAKPDKDNVEKLLVDALNGVAWVDDGQVQGGGIKRYGSPARIDVVLERLEASPVLSPADKRATKRLAEHVDVSRPLGVKQRTKRSRRRSRGRSVNE